MTMRVAIDKTDRGWELIYSYNSGPFCLGPEEESEAYATKAEALAACMQIAAAHRVWDRAGLADAPHMDAY